MTMFFNVHNDWELNDGNNDVIGKKLKSFI